MGRRDITALLGAARCPSSLKPQDVGLWSIRRRRVPEHPVGAAMFRVLTGGYDYQTVLHRMTEATMHTDGEIVMEDSRQELSRHLPIWLAARGRVLVSGLGLGCVVRALLTLPEVEHVDVIELDRKLIDVVGAEFAGSRVTIYHDDALRFDPERRQRWHYAWHDIWCEGNGLQLLHMRLLDRYRNRVYMAQGAWMLPRFVKRTLAHWNLIG